MSATSPNQRAYWHKTLRLTACLMAVLLTVTFGVAFFARELSFSFFGWPFSFWVGAQGALMVYVLIVAFYARAMSQLDESHGMGED